MTSLYIQLIRSIKGMAVCEPYSRILAMLHALRLETKTTRIQLHPIQNLSIIRQRDPALQSIVVS